MILSSGDFFLLYDKKKDTCLVTDCGGRSNKKYIFKNKTFLDILDIVDNKIIKNFDNKYALLSHLHSDHYNGFEQLSKKHLDYFDCFFLPYIAPGKKGCHILIDCAILCFLIYPKHFTSTVLSRNILKVIPMATSLSRSIKTVGRKDVIKVFNDSINVLWPPKDGAMWSNSFTEKCSTLISQLISSLNQSSTNNSLSIIRKSLQEYFDIIFSQENSKEQLLKISSEIDNIYEKLDWVRETSQETINNFV